MPNTNEALFFLVDDFMGTGKTAEEALNYYIDKRSIPKAQIIVLSIVAQKEAVDYIREKFEVKVFCPIIRDKGISGHYSSSKRDGAIAIMSSIEDWLGVRSEYRLGYGKSEALVTMLRTPNNTFPVFWLDKKSLGYLSPFSRG